MPQYAFEYDDLAKEESWRMFRIIGEFAEGFDHLSQVQPAITIFGSARTKPGDKYYELAGAIARGLGKRGFSIITGGGPGIMEAANKAAKEVGVPSVGLRIDLPNQAENQYANVTLHFHHFFVRKVMLVKYAAAFVLMPGGFGTLDELMETLTLIQTEKIRPFPVILVGTDYWGGLIDWMKKTVLAGEFISPKDLDLFYLTDDPERVFEIVGTWGKHRVGLR